MSPFLFIICAAALEPESASNEPRPDEARPPMVFFSPAGEPFRASSAEYPSRSWYSQADLNADGLISVQEFISDGARFFAALDENGDAKIAGAEHARYEEKLAPEISVNPMSAAQNGPPAGFKPPGGGRPPGGPPGGGPPSGVKPPAAAKHAKMPRGAGVFSFLNVPQPVKAADADFNGSVTEAEFASYHARLFKRLDKNKDGSIDFDELPETPMQKMISKMRPEPN